MIRLASVDDDNADASQLYTKRHMARMLKEHMVTAFTSLHGRVVMTSLGLKTTVSG